MPPDSRLTDAANCSTLLDVPDCFDTPDGKEKTMLQRVLVASLLLVSFWAQPTGAADKKPIKVLIITGDHGHKWQETTPFIKDFLTKAGMNVDVTQTPAKDLTEANLAQYDVLFLNYKDTNMGGPDTRWSDQNKKAFTDAIAGGKGLVIYHHASSAFTSGSDFDKDFEKIIAGGWRKQGNHGKRHVFKVAIRKADHPITKDMPIEFQHSNDELYQNSMMFPQSVVLATAFSDPKLDPKNSGKQEPVIWVATFGKGRVCENVLGHDVDAMQSLGFQTLLIRGVEWAATGEVHYPVPQALNRRPADS
jgi:type 1 glutamine amidotransferase